MPEFDQGEFLDLVYGAAADPDMWVPAMAMFADAVGGEKGWLSLLNLVDGSGGGLISRFDPHMMELYAEHFANCNPLHRVNDPRRFLQDWKPRILTDEDWMPKSDLVRTEYYNDFLRPQDIHSCIMVRLARRGSELATINITRPRARGQFEGADLATANALHPHLIRAFELGQKLSHDRQRVLASDAIFGASPHGLFILDRDGAVRHLNPAAGAMVGAGKALRIIGGRLTPSETNAARSLQAMIARAASPEGAVRTGGSMPLHSSEHEAPLSVMVAPLPTSTVSLLGDGPAVIVCVTDTEAEVRLPVQRLRDLFGVTLAEARTALAIFEGQTLKEAAQTLGVSRFTVQNHLARVFEKTGVNRQSALVRLMMRVVGLNLDADGQA
jgi:DNA-binding CsgD family transcriptional regulator/PAS domain-containing protein